MPTILKLADGGKVYFQAQSYSGQRNWPTSYIVDPYGLATTYSIVGDALRITDASGRWVQYHIAGNSRGTWVTRAEASTGEYVDYVWDTSVPAALHVQSVNTFKLLEARYADGSVATYQYISNVHGVFPYRCYDVRSSSNMRSVEYSFNQNLYLWGSVQNKSILALFPLIDERLPGSTTPVSSRSEFYVTSAGNGVRETRGDGAQRTFIPGSAYNWSDFAGKLASESDFTGNTTTYAYQLASVGNSWKATEVATDPYGRTMKFDYVSSGGTRHNDIIETPTKVTFTDGNSKQYAYTDINNPYYVSSTTDELGRVTYYYRNTNGTISQISYPDGSYETWGYNGFNEVMVHRLRNGAYEWVDYDAAGRMIRKWEPSFSGQQAYTSYTYYGTGSPWNERVQTSTDPRGNSTTYEYDRNYSTGAPCYGRGLVTRVTNADGTSKAFGYDVYGNKTSEINELGQAATFTYDQYNRLRTTTDSLGRTTTRRYADSNSDSDPEAVELTYNQPKHIISPLGKMTTTLYDANRRPWLKAVGDGTSEVKCWSYAYDAVGNLIDEKEQVGGSWGSEIWRETTFAYNSRYRTITQTAPLGRVTQWAYDAVGNVTQVTNPDGTITHKDYDAMNQVRHSWDEMNQLTQYTYYSSGKIYQTIDPRGNTYTYAYDAALRPTSLTYPGGSSEQWQYDAAGNKTIEINRSSQVLRLYFDNRNREYWRAWDNNAATSVWTGYDAASRVTSKSNWHGALTYAYDAAGQVTSETQKIYGPTSTEDGQTATVSFTYDSDGNRSSVGAPSVYLAYVYNAREQMTAVQFGGGWNWSTYTYNGAAERSSRSYANGTTSDYSYDGAGRLTTLNTHRSDGSGILKQTFGYDSRDRRTYVVRDDQYGDTWRYQPDSQLIEQRTQVWRPDQNFWNGASFTDGFAYDTAGNRTSWNENGVVTSYSTDALNQYTSVTGMAIQHADGRGNVTTIRGWSFTYDADNRLTRAMGPGHDIWPHYDAQGRLCKVVDNGVYQYRIYDGSQVLIRMNQDGSWIDHMVWGPSPDELISRYVPGSGSDWWHSWQFAHQDPLNSVVAFTNCDQTVLERYRYDAFGGFSIFDGNWNARTSSAIANRYQFTGQEFWPEMGLSNYKARFYSPELGRFIQQDPVRFDAGDLNLYRYCQNNALNINDPSGLVGQGANGTSIEDDQFGGSPYVTVLAQFDSSPEGNSSDETGAHGQTRLDTGRPESRTSSGSQFAQVLPPILLEDTIIPIPPEVLDEAVKLNNDANRVNLPDGRKVHLKGASHFNKGTGEEVPTPHVHDPQAPFDPPYNNIPRPANPVPRPATPQDIHDVIKHLNEPLPKALPFNPVHTSRLYLA